MIGGARLGGCWYRGREAGLGRAGRGGHVLDWYAWCHAWGSECVYVGYKRFSGSEVSEGGVSRARLAAAEKIDEMMRGGREGLRTGADEDAGFLACKYIFFCECFARANLWLSCPWRFLKICAGSSVWRQWGEFRGCERVQMGMRGFLHANIYFFVRCLRGLTRGYRARSGC